MGCFSFICKVCGEPILSNSYRGENVKLYLLKDGEIIEQMEGEYDSYGRVFDKNSDSIKWYMGWSDVCDLGFDSDKGNGILAVHSKCEYNTDIIEKLTRSEDDTNQGWGGCDELMDNCDIDFKFNE